MGKVLIVTVGGAAEPLVTCINRYQPDYVIFLCSADTKKPLKVAGSHNVVDGDGFPCKDRDGKNKPSIVVQTKLSEGQYKIIIIPNIDSLSDCYLASQEAFSVARELFPQLPIIADYTGGTKSMSAGIVAAALDDGNVDLSIVKGERSDLVKVRSGTQRATRGDWLPVAFARWLTMIKQLFSQYDYDGCLELINRVSSEVVAGTDEDEILQVFRTVSKALHSWDQFLHEQALEDLSLYAAYFPREKAYLIEVIRCKKAYEKADKDERLRLHLVYDLLRNAERRLSMGRYDEAVARIYRSIEMLSQCCLLFNKPSINTSQVDIDVLPANLREKYMIMKKEMNPGLSEDKLIENKLQLGLFRAYELLVDLGHPLGEVYKNRKQRLQHLIQMRNFSIMAHGLNPTSGNEAREFYIFACDMVMEFEKLMKLRHGYTSSPSFPIELPDKLFHSEHD